MTLDPSNYCGTNLNYGQIGIRNCTLKSFDQSVRYDESNVDAMFHDYEITVVGQIHQDPSWFVDGVSAGDIHPKLGVDDEESVKSAGPKDAIEVAKTIQSYLLQPRLNLKLYIGSTILLEVEQTSSKTNIDNNPAIYDCDGGPKPIRCRVVEVVGLNYFHVEFTVKCSVSQQDPDNLPSSLSNLLIEPPTNNLPWVTDTETSKFVMSNRWQMSESRDKDFLLTRTVAGKMRMRHESYLPLTFAHMVTPPQAKNMQVISQEFTTSTNGLELTYRIIHRQRYAAPPAPAIDWNGKHTERTNMTGTTSTGNVQINLKGAPGTPKQSLFFAALQMCIHKLTDQTGSDGLGGKGPQNFTLGPIVYRSLVLVDTLHENEISLAMTTERPIVQSASQGKIFGGIQYGKLGLLPAVAAFAPAHDTGKDYLPSSLVKNGGNTYRAKKYIEAGAFSAADWEDITSTVVDRDDNAGKFVEQWPHPQAYDPHTTLGQFANYWQNPLVANHGMPTGKTAGRTDESRPTGFDDVAQHDTAAQFDTAPSNAVYASIDDYTPEIPDDGQDIINPEHQNSIYLELQAETIYDVDTGIQGMPLSVPTNTPTPTNTATNLADRLSKTGMNANEITHQTDINRYFIFLGPSGGESIATNWRDYYATTAFVKLQSDLSNRRVKFRGKRVGARPNAPALAAFLVDPNNILERVEHYQVSPGAPIPAANGQQLQWDIEASLDYIMERPIDYTGEAFKTPSLPWDISTLADNQLQYASVSDSGIV